MFGHGSYGSYHVYDVSDLFSESACCSRSQESVKLKTGLKIVLTRTRDAADNRLLLLPLAGQSAVVRDGVGARPDPLLPALPTGGRALGPVRP